MESILSLLLGVRVERNAKRLKPFSLDEAILGVKNTFETWSSSLLLQTVFRAVDIEICGALTGKSTDPASMLLNLNHKPCCAEPGFERARECSRKIATTLAELKLSGTRIRCVSCKKSFVPLFVFLGITRYQNKSQELVKIVFENICDQSYRRGKKQLDHWNAKGVAVLCHIILIRCMNNDLWENYWKKILNVTGNLKLTSVGAYMKNQELSLLH